MTYGVEMTDGDAGEATFFFKERMMMGKRFKPVYSFLLVCLFLCSLPGISHSVELSKTFVITSDDLAAAETFSLGFILRSSEITIIQDDSDAFVVKAAVTYDSTVPEPMLSTTAFDGEFKAIFQSGEDMENRSALYTDTQKWTVTIGRYGLKTDLNIAGGGMALQADLGGMPLNSLMVTAAGAGIDINFSRPTSIASDTLSIIGAGILFSLNNIGNTDFNTFSLINAGTQGHLDFSGEYTPGKRFVNITGAGNQLNIRLPETAGQRVAATALGAAVLQKGPGWIVDVNLLFYKKLISQNYDAREVTIDMEVLTSGSMVVLERR